VLSVKREVLVFALCLRDQLGLIADVSQVTNSLVRLQETQFSGRLIAELDQKVAEAL